MRNAVPWLLLATIAACDAGRGSAQPMADPVPPSGPIDPGPIDPVLSAEPCHKMDLLFVIDDSGSMKEEQANLAANFPKYMKVLDAYQTELGTPLDYRVAVTTTSRDVVLFNIVAEAGDNGALRQRCGMTRRWIERGDPGDLGAQFACLAEVGTAGTSIEMPLEAGIKLALGDRVQDGTNAGFLRDDALLAIVLITDEEDCSRQDVVQLSADECVAGSPSLRPVSTYVDLLDQLKTDRSRWATAVIAGPGPGQCTSAFGSASEATRLKQFVAETGANGVFSSICEGDLTAALSTALDTFDAACQAFTQVL
jgi:hypothetical protein